MKSKGNLILLIIALILIGAIFVFLNLLTANQDRIGQEDSSTIDGTYVNGGELSLEDEVFNPGDIIQVEEAVLNPSFPVALRYSKHQTPYTYLFVGEQAAYIRSGPSVNNSVIKKASYGDKLDYFESVYIAGQDGNEELWFHVSFEEKGQRVFGFANSTDVTFRLFQFDKMEEGIKRVQTYENMGRLTYVSNYKNLNGYAPLYKGADRDPLGNYRSQSAPAYSETNDLENFIYIEDGTLVRILFPQENFVKVQIVDTGELYYIPARYIPEDHFIHDFNKAIIIDVTNQNEGVYEKIAGEWTLISYTQATTGKVGKYSSPTPTGYFFAMEKKPYFRYYEDGTTNIQGYAPYAVRFAGGAYVHGVPVNYRYTADGSRITPPTVENSATLGTVPLSHKCVRNYTSHAEFLYDWFTPGETVVIVID